MCWPYPTQKFGHEKAFSAMSIAFPPPEKKRNQMTVLEECLARIQRYPRDFPRETEDENWIYYYTQEIKEESKQ